MDTDFYHADGVFFEHEFHGFHESFWAHGYSRMDTDLPCGPLDIIRTLKRRTNWSSPL